MNYIVQQYYYYNNNKQIIKCLQESVILRKIKTLISDLEWKFTKKLFKKKKKNIFKYNRIY